MFKKAQHRAVILGLLFPLATQALSCRGISENDASIAVCDVSFSTIPTFANFCVGAIVLGRYSITNNTPVTLKINYIRIQNNDTAPKAASSIITAPTNNCSSSLASGSSCNILIKLQPLVLGKYNRVLQVGINSRQIEVDAPAITSSVNCIPTPPSPTPPTPVGPHPATGPDALYAETIIANAGVTNTGNSVVNGNLDAFPTPSVTGFPPGLVTGTINANAGAPLAQATNYYAAATAPALACQHNLTGQNLGGKTLAPGVYCFNTSAQLTGALTLAGTSSQSSYTFQIGSTLITAPNSSVIVTGGVKNDNITWAVGSSATLGTGTAFHGIIDAVASISLNTGASLAGRAWALNGAVTLQNNAVNPSS